MREGWQERFAETPDVLIGVRVSPEQELEGLDVSMHGEEGYNLET